MYRAFVRDLAARLTTTGLPVTWAWDPPDAPVDDVLPGARRIGQPAGDLGARMAAGIAAVSARSALPVIVLGVDTPHVDLDAIAAAAAALAGEADVVVGPARDGGYYLIGVRGVVAGLFDGVPWGTPTVLATQRERARALGLRVVEVREDFDVDDADDLAALRRLLDAGAVVLTETAAVLAALGPPV